jgi:uncharacterized SAM-binding protein YcdF (DUF218 family)
MTNSERTTHRRIRTVSACILLALALFVLAMLRWGGYLLIKSEPLPRRADGAVILQASLPSENARIAGAVQLLQQGTVDKVLLSIPKQGYWNLSLPDLAHSYLQKQYGDEIASQISFCETAPNVDSTEQEALAIMPCIQQYHWHSLIVVTSNFHSRRAAMIWHRTWRRVQPPVQLYVDGVADPLFQPEGWWRHREYAKTWFFESTKLFWTIFS